MTFGLEEVSDNAQATELARLLFLLFPLVLLVLDSVSVRDHANRNIFFSHVQRTCAVY